jgi:hypothetical protein
VEEKRGWEGGLTGDDELCCGVVTEEAEVFGGGDVADEAAWLGGELGFVLGVDGEREDVPCVQGLAVGGGQVEGGYLVF